MKTAGDILKAERLARGWSLGELSRRTRIQSKFITALEAMDLAKLPAAAFVKGFIRTAAVELELNPDGIVAIFRRDYGSDNQGHIVPRILEPEVTGNKFHWTPKTTIIAVITVVITVFISYLAIQLRLLTSAPMLVIDEPEDSILVSDQVLIEGRTDPTATVKINGQEIKKNRSGIFSQLIELPAGIQTITITSQGQNGKSTTVERTVQVKPNDSK